MGIFGLFSFMSKDCENGFQEVYLKDIATQYKKETGKDPVMLVDASSFVRFLGKNANGVFSLLALEENLETFINKCYKMGIKLKFVGEGLRPREKYDLWVSRTVNGYLNKKSSYGNFLVCSLMTTAESIYQSSDKCEFIRSMYESDSYIMRYAKTEGCFAILSNDSDLLIAEGSHYFLRLPELNLINMSTYNYNRNSLAESLGLRQSLLPVFASLCETQLEGNDYRSRRDKCILNPRELLNTFQESAERIKKCPFQEDFNEILNHVTEKMTREEADKIKKKFRFYSGEEEKGFPPSENTHWNDILLAAERRHVTGAAEKSVLEILRERVAFRSPKYNFRVEPTIVQKLKPIREKIYGILFSECPENDVSVKEYSFTAKGKYPVPDVKDVTFQRLSHCGLLRLWSQDRSEEMMHERRRLFCEAVDKNLTPAILDELDIPEKLLFPVLAMFYISRHVESNLSYNERNTLLTLIVLAQKTRRWRRATQLLFQVDPAELELAEPFLTTTAHFKLLNSVCGEPFSRAKTGVINYYDGDLFHFVYRHVVKGKPLPKFLQVNISAERCDLNKKLENLKSACAGPAHAGVELASTAAV